MPSDNLSWRRDFYILTLYLLFVNTFFEKIFIFFIFLQTDQKVCNGAYNFLCFFVEKQFIFNEKYDIMIDSAEYDLRSLLLYIIKRKKTDGKRILSKKEPRRWRSRS